MGCPECERLWKLYGELIRDQMVLLAEYARALHEGERGRVRTLNAAMDGSHTFCKEGWAELRAHEVVHDGKARPAQI